MKVIRKNDQHQIQTETCGLLTEVINRQDTPFSIVLANDLKPTKPHYHKKVIEIYWVLEGQVDLEITGNNQKREIKLNVDDLVIIDKEEIHEVVKVSKRNKVIVLNSPPWQKEDEYLMR